MVRALWRLDDPTLVQAGHRGERWLAGARLRLFLALWLIPLSWLFTRDMQGWEVRVGLAAAAGAVAGALAWVARRPRLPAWFGLASGAMDVSLVSAALGAFLLVGQPLAAVNSLVVFEFYFLALAATALRYDWRVCAVAGVVAVVEYVGLAAYAAARWALTDPRSAVRVAASGYAAFGWSAVVGRAVALALAAGLAAQVVARVGRPRTASVRDRLTGVANRAYFDERLAEEVARARRTGRPLALALLDLDHFKRVNDQHGHLAGDAVLQAAATVLRAQVRRHDVLARYGGEEFALLLVDVEAERAARRVDALRTALSARRVPLPTAAAPAAAVTAGEIAVTASAGVALAAEALTSEAGPAAAPSQAAAAGAVPATDAGAEAALAQALLHLADERLYAAKALGRDRVIGPAGAGALLRDSATRHKIGRTIPTRVLE